MPKSITIPQCSILELEPYQTSLDSRHETMQAMVADLANNAFSCATMHGDFHMAVEFLEQSRGIL